MIRIELGTNNGGCSNQVQHLMTVDERFVNWDLLEELAESKNLVIIDTEYDYPFTDGDTYFTLDGDEFIESTWDCTSEEIHDANPDKVYYREPNKESKL